MIALDLCCNPCCNGINHRQIMRKFITILCIVVILVVMESIIDQFLVFNNKHFNCCNPCCNGINHR